MAEQPKRTTQMQERPAADRAPRQEKSMLALIQENVPSSKMAQYQAHGYDGIRLAMVWDQVARDLSLAEFLYFMERATVTGLDPLRGQMHAIKRRDQSAPSGFKVTHQVSIDGFRAQAAKSGAYAGQDPPEYAEPVDFYDKPAHEVCRVTVYRIVQGVRVPFVGECRLSEYFPGERQGGMWKQYPHNQLAKCTEAQALRKAFPVELGGLISDGEPTNNDLEAQFADTVMNRGDVGPQYIEVTDQKTGEVTQARAGDEYARLHPDDDDDAPVMVEDRAIQASVAADDARRETEQAPAPVEDNDPPPWAAQPQRKMTEAMALRASSGLCMHLECVEHNTKNKAVADTKPPRCLNHVG